MISSAFGFTKLPLKCQVGLPGCSSHRKNLFPRSLSCWQHSVISILPNWRLHFLIGCQGRELPTVPHYVPLSIRQFSTRQLSFGSQKETQPLRKQKSYVMWLDGTFDHLYNILLEASHSSPGTETEGVAHRHECQELRFV